MTRIAIAGPDGAGKSSVCHQLQRLIPDSHVEYAGKARNHKLKSTRFAYKIWQAGKSLVPALDFPLRYFWFYPFEFFEIRHRFEKLGAGETANIIYDRHPVDRMVLLHDLRLKRLHGRVSTPRYLCEWLPRFFWAWVYTFFFRFDGKVFVLLPAAELCFDRSKGQYKDLIDAAIRVDSYRTLFESGSTRHDLTRIDVFPEQDVGDVVGLILARIQDKA